MRRFNTSYTSSATGTTARLLPGLPQLPRGTSYGGNCNAGVS
jgi:dual specificity MAP kinase phosphatase